MKRIWILALMVEFGWTPYIAAAQPPGTFSATGSMLTGRAWQTATLLPNGKVLIAGGFSEVGTAVEGLSSAELYDPATGAPPRDGKAMTKSGIGNYRDA